MSNLGNGLSTTVDKDFLDNFYPLVNENNGKNVLKFFCPYIDANSMNYDNLIISLRDAAGHYCLSRRTWDEYVKKPMQLSHLVREKFRKLDQNKGELGELLLFAFLEADLKAPKLLTKMELKTNPNMYFNGADGVHYLKLNDGNYQLIFGESKAYANLGSGISAALQSIHDFKNDSIKDDESNSFKGITFEKGLLNACIGQEAYTEEEKAFVKALIYPKATCSYAVDTAFAVFVLYDLEIDPKEKQRDNQDFRQWIFDNLTESIKEEIPSIFESIENKGLTGHCFYFYIVPFEKMANSQKNVLAKVVE